MSQEEDDAESALVAELRALAGDGAGDDGQFEVRWGGHTITVIHNSGSSSNVRLRAAYDDVARADHPALVSLSENDGSYRQAPSPGSLRAPRPLAIALHHETPADARAVAEGVRREHQTGDHAFDTAVFIATPTTNDAVLRAVLGPEVRAAVLSLFALGFLRVTIDDAIIGDRGFVEAYLWSFTLRDPPAERGRRCLDAFARVLDHLPTITPSGEAHASPNPGGWIRFLGWVGVVGVLAGVPALWLGVAMSAQCTEDSPLRPECEAGGSVALIAALVVGAIASWIARPALIRRFGERSGSFLPVAAGRLKVFAGCAVLAFFLLFFAFLLVRRV
jgi:hypothetical protein